MSIRDFKVENIMIGEGHLTSILGFSLNIWQGIIVIWVYFIYNLRKTWPDPKKFQLNFGIRWNFVI